MLLLSETLREQVGEPQGRTGFSVSGVVACGKPLRVYVYLDNLFLGSPLCSECNYVLRINNYELERSDMTTVNDPTVVTEVTDLYLKYEEALCNNNLEVMDSLFWDGAEVVRFGITENLYGGDEIRKFRASRPSPKIEREISNLKVVTFGKDAATVTLEFYRNINGVERFGRQSQTWYRFTEGWKVVSAHVSLLPV
ncbi:MAG: oxalurate catabolism protein HpxZ [Nostoc sp.]